MLHFSWVSQNRRITSCITYRRKHKLYYVQADHKLYYVQGEAQAVLRIGGSTSCITYRGKHKLYYVQGEAQAILRTGGSTSCITYRGKHKLYYVQGEAQAVLRTEGGAQAVLCMGGGGEAQAVHIMYGGSSKTYSISVQEGILKGSSYPSLLGSCLQAMKKKPSMTTSMR